MLELAHTDLQKLMLKVSGQWASSSLEMGHGGSSHTTEIGKCYESGLFPREPVLKHLPKEPWLEGPFSSGTGGETAIPPVPETRSVLGPSCVRVVPLLPSSCQIQHALLAARINDSLCFSNVWRRSGVNQT